MSNQNTELQKTETSNSFIEKTASDTLSKTLSTLFAGGIIAVISMVISFVYGLPYYLYLPLGALAFCFVGLGFYLFSFRPTNKLLKAENESLKEAKQETVLLESPEDKKQIESIQIEHQKEIESLNEKQREELQKRTEVLESAQQDFAQLIEIAKTNTWLIKLAEKQAKNISDYVKLDKFFFCRIEEKPIPRAVFSLYMVNKSVFDVTLESKIDGFIEFLITSSLIRFFISKRVVFMSTTKYST